MLKIETEDTHTQYEREREMEIELVKERGLELLGMLSGCLVFSLV